MPGNIAQGSGFHQVFSVTDGTLSPGNCGLLLENQVSAGVSIIGFGFPVAGPLTVLAAIKVEQGTMTFVCQENAGFSWKNTLGNEAASIEPSDPATAADGNNWTMMLKGALNLTNSGGFEIRLYAKLDGGGIPQLYADWQGQTAQLTSFVV